MTFAHVILLCGGVLVLLLAFGLLLQSRRRSYRLRDLTDLSSEIDPDWERIKPELRAQQNLRDVSGDADDSSGPPEERSS
jgi:hypothetical protein